MDFPQDADAIWLVGLCCLSPTHTHTHTHPPIWDFFIQLGNCRHKSFLNQREPEFNFMYVLLDVNLSKCRGLTLLPLMDCQSSEVIKNIKQRVWWYH